MATEQSGRRKEKRVERQENRKNKTGRKVGRWRRGRSSEKKAE